MASMDGKLVLITGGNSGIGKATADSLAGMGAELTLLCRDPQKAEAARADIVAKTGAKVDLIIADMLSQKEVRRAALDFTSTHDRLDVLLNNAGAEFFTYQETEDGIERTMAVNYFSPFLLTNLLLDVVKRSAPSRIVNVSSEAHYGRKLDFDNINGKGSMGAGGLDAYGRSKLALVLFTYELARRLKGTGVTANCLHPGRVRTNMWSRGGILSPLMKVVTPFLMSPEEGAKTSVYLASSPEVEGVTGEYFERCKPKRSSVESYDQASAARLWELSERTTGLIAHVTQGT